MKQEELKSMYGWSIVLETFFLHSNPSLRGDNKGTFRIKKQGGKFFWYYQLSKRVKDRDKYLCSVEPKELGKNQSSFEYCCLILLEKLQSNFTISSRNKSDLSTYISLYQEKIEHEKIENFSHSRKKETINGMLNSIRDFKRFSVEKNIKLYQVPQKEFKELMIQYVNSLVKRNIKLSSIKTYLQDIRSFLNYLTLDKPNGIEIILSHPISLNFQNDVLLNYYVPKPPPYEPKPFSDKSYETIYQDCLDRVKGIWTRYCETGKLERIKDKKGKINQPIHFLGRDVVWFISYFQIRGGFRVGEILYSYRNRDVFNDFHLSNFPKEMGSYWERSKEGWMLVIKNSKGKDRNVPFTDTIRTWVEPPKHIPSTLVKDKNGNSLYWDTQFVDIVMELFPNSFYTFPSPNHQEKPNKPRSITYYMNTFRDECVLKSEWESLGVISSHNLRSFFISYSIRKNDISPLEICSLTGHTITTMEKYYLRENMTSKFNTIMKKLSQKQLISSMSQNEI